jgi:hypothetical protein
VERFLRNLAYLLVTSRLVGEALTTMRPDFALTPDVDRKIHELISTGEQGDLELRRPMRESGIVLPAGPDGAGASHLVSTLCQGLYQEGLSSGRTTEAIVNLRLLAQHLELRTRLSAEEAKLAGEEPLGRVLSNWARRWWIVAHA